VSNPAHDERAARRGAGARRGARSLIASSGAVGAAVAGHVSGGGARPASLVLAVLVLLLTGLFAVLPKRLRTVRRQILAAVILQPVLHVAFELAPARVTGPGRDLGAGLLAMVLTHAAAALATAWCLRQADRLVGVAADVAETVRRRFRSLVPLVPLRSTLPAIGTERPLAGRLVAASLSGRGPPTGPAPVLCT
jgi:hypothetical protein